jgi:hypothetical protein
MTPALFGRESGRSEITRENTLVTYVIAFANFYCDASGFEPPDPRNVRGTKVATAR